MAEEKREEKKEEKKEGTVPEQPEGQCAGCECDDVERMREEMVKYATGALVEKLLPVMDGFAKAGAHAPESTDENVIQWCQGIGHVQMQFEKALADAGLTVIDEAGVPFDPAVHEAMLREKKEGAEPDTVTEVLEPGYRLHDRVIRAAKVKVAE